MKWKKTLKCRFIKRNEEFSIVEYENSNKMIRNSIIDKFNFKNDDIFFIDLNVNDKNETSFEIIKVLKNNFIEFD